MVRIAPKSCCSNLYLVQLSFFPNLLICKDATKKKFHAWFNLSGASTYFSNQIDLL